MKWRPFALAAAAAAVALVTAGRPMPARADNITTAEYRLTSDHDIAVPDPSATGPQVVAEVVPPGSVIPPTQTDGTQASPLTILNSSKGFDQNHLIVALKDNVSNAGSTSSTNPEQLFGLSFFGSGFSKSGQLDFSLSIDKSLSKPPTLQSLTPGVTITALQTAQPPTTTTSTSSSQSTGSQSSSTSTSTSTNSGSGSTTVTSTSSGGGVQTAQIPEPMSVLLWSALTGAGLIRARAFRRAA